MKMTRKSENRREVKISELSGWQLICMFNHGDTEIINVPANVVNAIRNETWKLQDGYGQAGFVPAQGWDWSGIRDSSDLATMKMGAAILSTLVRFCFTTLVVEDVRYEVLVNA
jgi:hypothetical protein